MLNHLNRGRGRQSVPKNRETRSFVLRRDANTSSRSEQPKEQAISKLAAADLYTDPRKRCLGPSLSRNQEWRKQVALETGTCLRQSAHPLAHPVAKELSYTECRACRVLSINCFFPSRLSSFLSFPSSLQFLNTHTHTHRNSYHHDLSFHFSHDGCLPCTAGGCSDYDSQEQYARPASALFLQLTYAPIDCDIKLWPAMYSSVAAPDFPTGWEAETGTSVTFDLSKPYPIRTVVHVAEHVI